MSEAMAQRCAQDILNADTETRWRLIGIHRKGISEAEKELMRAEATVAACRRAIDLRLRVLELVEEGTP